jgi:hypothetical protein
MPYNISKPSLPPTTRVTPLPSLSASEGDNQLTKGIYGKPLKRFIFVFGHLFSKTSELGLSTWYGGLHSLLLRALITPICVEKPKSRPPVPARPPSTLLLPLHRSVVWPGY